MLWRPELAFTNFPVYPGICPCLPLRGPVKDSTVLYGKQDKIGWSSGKAGINFHSCPRSRYCNNQGNQNLFPRSPSFIIKVFLWFKKHKHMERRWKLNQKDNGVIAMCPFPSIRQKIPREHKPFGHLACNTSAYFGESKHELVCCRSYWGQSVVCNGSLASLTWRA